MDGTTIKRMELKHQKPDAYLTTRVSAEYKAFVREMASKIKMDESKFIRSAVEEKIERLITE